MTAFLVMHLPVMLFAQASEPDQRWVQGGKLKLYTQAYKSKNSTEEPVLLVAIHGDAPFNQPDYHYNFARRAAASYRNLIAVGLLRPGYTDPQGNKSEGTRGQSTGDNWHAANTDAVAAVINQLAKHYRVNKVVVAGHSGGAAMTANILGRHPTLIHRALLVSLPSDLHAWRQHMFDRTGAQIFRHPIQTPSALDLVPMVSQQVMIQLVVGAQDDITPAWLSKRYHSAAIKHGKQVDLKTLPAKGHEIFLDPAVFEHLATLLER